MPTRDDVYSQFGRTAEAAQLFETELGTILIARKGEVRGWSVKANPEEAADFYEKLNRKTLGQLLNDLPAFLSLDEQATECFKSALKARNDLNHGFFERHDFAIFSEQGRVAMLDDLEALHVRLAEAYNMAQPIAMQLVSRVQAARTSSTSPEASQ